VQRRFGDVAAPLIDTDGTDGLLGFRDTVHLCGKGGGDEGRSTASRRMSSILTIDKTEGKPQSESEGNMSGLPLLNERSPPENDARYWLRRRVFDEGWGRGGFFSCRIRMVRRKLSGFPRETGSGVLLP